MTENRIGWEDSYRIGDPEIDQQHRELIELVAGLCDHDAYDDAKLAKVLDYAMYHFSAEEALQEEIGYPDYEAHRAQHRQLTERLCVLRDQYWARAIEPREFSRFMLDWVLVHIREHDACIGAFLAQRGAAA